jgi:fibrillarin-like pre-rRNA processing protein
VRVARPPRPTAENPRLARTRVGDRPELWTETVGSMPSVFGERWAEFDGRTFRSFEPSRSKLASALVKGWTGGVPATGERWLYLGAASGTTASYVADLVGPAGRVYALERSLRPFSRLLGLAERWPNLLPVLGDAREPREYSGLVPPVDGIYADIAQPDQVAILRTNAAWYLRGPGTRVLLALKASSMGREVPPARHLSRTEEELRAEVHLAPSVSLDPFHRAHYLVGGRVRATLFGPAAAPRPAARPPPGRSLGRPRP